jgi:hypothetical protein
LGRLEVLSVEFPDSSVGLDTIMLPCSLKEFHSRRFSNLLALKNTTALVSLSIYDATIADFQSMPDLAALKRLNVSWCPNLSVIKDLARMKNLKSLSFKNNRKILPNDVEAMRKALPECEIESSN